MYDCKYVYMFVCMVEYIPGTRTAWILCGSGSGHRASVPCERGAVRGLRADQGALRVFHTSPRGGLFQDIVM